MMVTDNHDPHSSSSSADDWLNLTLVGGNDHTFLMPTSDNQRHGRLLSNPTKLFRCKYCTRKFINSRALGGHQNAHKRERGEAYRLRVERKRMGQKPDTVQALDMEPHHALLLSPVKEEVPKEREHTNMTAFSLFEANQTSQGCVEGKRLIWPGSFQSYSPQMTSYDGSKMASKEPDHSYQLQGHRTLADGSYLNLQLLHHPPEQERVDISLDLRL